MPCARLARRKSNGCGSQTMSSSADETTGKDRPNRMIKPDHTNAVPARRLHRKSTKPANDRSNGPVGGRMSAAITFLRWKNKRLSPYDVAVALVRCTRVYMLGML